MVMAKLVLSNLQVRLSKKFKIKIPNQRALIGHQHLHGMNILKIMLLHIIGLNLISSPHWYFEFYHLIFRGEEPTSTNMDISTGHMVLAYMEDHLKNKQRLEQEWVALCGYEAEPCATTIAFKVIKYDLV